MRNVLLLLKLQLDNQSDLLKTKAKKLIPTIIKILFLFVLGTLAVGVALARVEGMGFAINRELLTIVLLATQVISLVFATGNIIKTLYMSKDNEMLFCLPVTPNQLFISKLLVIYIKEVAVNAAISVPLYLVLGFFEKSFSASYYISILMLLFLLPITPIALGAFLSIPLMIVIKFLRKHPILSIVIIFSIVASCLWAYTSLVATAFTELDFMGEEQIQTIISINSGIQRLGAKIFIYYQIAGAMLSFSMWYVYPLFILACLGIAVATIFFTKYFFFKAAMSSLEKTIRKRREPEYDTFKKQGILASLLKKEILCVFRSPSDVFEYFLFTILMPIIVFSYDQILLSIVIDQGGTDLTLGAHLMVVAILAMLSNISSASAISRDGGNFYMSKMVPVSYYSQIFAKFLFNAVFTAAALLVTSIVSLFLFPAWEVILGTIAIIFAAIGHIAYSIDSDIKNPTVNNEGDEKSSTVSKSTPKSLIYGLAIGFVMGVFVMITTKSEATLIPYFILIGAAFAFMIYRINTLVLRINLRYDKIEM